MSINLKEKHKCSYRIKERILCALIWADPIPFQKQFEFYVFLYCTRFEVKCAQLQNWRLQHLKLQFPKLKNCWNFFVHFHPKIKGHQELEQNRNLQIVCINTGIKYVQLKAPAEWVNTAKYFLICAIQIILFLLSSNARSM